jgi:hypothetical protein
VAGKAAALSAQTGASFDEIAQNHMEKIRIN